VDVYLGDSVDSDESLPAVSYDHAVSVAAAMFKGHTSEDGRPPEKRVTVSIRPTSFLPLSLIPMASRQPGKVTQAEPSPGINPDTFYTCKDAAALLRVGQSTVYDMIRSGDVATVRTGTAKGYRIKGADLLAWIDSRKEGGPRRQGP
jgi:excisionase family DNA binding protein